MTMTPFSPPPDFIKDESAVPGITVYRPRPPDTLPEDRIVAFHCPQCDGETAYSTEDQGLTCTYCGYHEAPQQPVVGKKAEEFEFTVDAVRQAGHGWGVERKTLSCQRCGAQTTLSPEMLSHQCPFCGSNQVLQARAAQDILRPRYLVPLIITPDEVRQRIQTWLGSSWMTPGGLKRLAALREFVPVYIPYWTFDARATATWRAEVGHTRTRTVYVNGRRETRTEIVWRWESGQVSLFHDDILVPGTDKLSQRLLGQTRGFDLQALVPYDAAFLAGISAQAYDVKLETAWATGRHEMRERTRAACRDQASTRRIRNFSMNLDFGEESWRHILAPVYLAHYRYRDQPFQVMVNGQTGLVAGQRPVDWTRVWLVIGALFLPGLLLGFVALITLILGLGTVIGLLALLALGLALVFAVQIYSRAAAMDDL